MITGCSLKAENPDYPAIYEDLSLRSGGDPPSGAETDITLEYPELAGFIGLFRNIKRDDVAEQVREIYAGSLYFSDTLKTLYDNEALAAYLEETAQRITFNRVTVHQVIPAGGDYFLRWSMKTGFDVFGKSIETHSIGMSQLRLDDSGKVIFHQDFWDNTEGLFRHLPVLGYFISRTRDRF